MAQLQFAAHDAFVFVRYVIGRVLAIRIDSLSWKRKRERDVSAASSSGDLRKVQ